MFLPFKKHLSGSKWNDDGADLSPKSERGVNIGSGLTESGSGTPGWVISLTYLQISGSNYNDGMYFATGQFSAIQEVAIAEQSVTGGVLGADNFDWATCNVTGGDHDGEAITVLFNITSFISQASLETYLKTELGATSVSATNFFSSGNVSANGPTSDYNWSLPGVGSYATGSDPASSGYLDYSSGSGTKSLGDDQIYIINGLVVNGVSDELDDDEEFSLPKGIVGYGYIVGGDNEERSSFTYASDGAVTLGADATANMVNTDTDSKLCIYNDSGTIKVKNRIGSNKRINLFLQYYN